MEEYNFDEFNSVGTRFNPTISLGDSERFYLGGSFCRKYNISDMVGVKLMYDKAKNAVGFRFLIRYYTDTMMWSTRGLIYRTIIWRSSYNAILGWAG